jgi:SAM-dependent methyltransferase
MSDNETNMYGIDSHIAEWYDRSETYTDDVELIRRLIEGMGPLRILELFCGTGRILIPLAQDGHELMGLDKARAMLDRARMKISSMSTELAGRVTLIEADVVTEHWPEGFDLVILGGNCFYELATPEEQEGCIASASAALRSGGYVYLDNNHMEGELEESWRKPGVRGGRLPNGVCDDGAILEGTTETTWCDIGRRLWRARRTLTVTFSDGTKKFRDGIQQKHPVSVVEQRDWLNKHGFVIEQLFGDRAGNPYTDASGRGIFWARKA